jgi:hypothetical protein
MPRRAVPCSTEREVKDTLDDIPVGASDSADGSAMCWAARLRVIYSAARASRPYSWRIR